MTWRKKTRRSRRRLRARNRRSPRRKLQLESAGGANDSGGVETFTGFEKRESDSF
jgi:hypothetical protein